MPKTNFDWIKLGSLCAVLAFLCTAAMKGTDIVRTPDMQKQQQEQINNLQVNCLTNFQQIHMEIQELYQLIEQNRKETYDN